jgi:hypothetical protein
MKQIKGALEALVFVFDRWANETGIVYTSCPCTQKFSRRRNLRIGKRLLFTSLFEAMSDQD